MADDQEPALPEDEELLERFVRAKKANTWLLLSKPHVIGTDIGYRRRGGEITDELVVKVYVSRKVERIFLAEDDLIPATLEVEGQEVPIDVEEGTIPQPSLFTLRSRPLRGGSSIGPATGGTGTLGICVTRNDGRAYMLSNDHVIGNSAGQTLGAEVIQPSRGDGGAAPNDVVGRLSDFVAVDFGTTTITLPFGIRITVRNTNYVDAALARIGGANVFNVGNREVHWIGYPNLAPGYPWTFAKIVSLINRRVCKMGRTTEYTQGIINSVFYDVLIGPYPNGQFAWFEDQIRIGGEGAFATSGFSQGGDSGSLVVDFETREPLGLLFSGAVPYSNANRLDEVMQRLRIPQL